MGHLGRFGSEQFTPMGAIFMANTSTRKECFALNTFGLPTVFKEFVLSIQAGAILFLFDHEDRNLYGVFEATTDGAMNIVPYAYLSSGRSFPAQTIDGRSVQRCYKKKITIIQENLNLDFHMSSFIQVKVQMTYRLFSRWRFLLITAAFIFLVSYLTPIFLLRVGLVFSASVFSSHEGPITLLRVWLIVVAFIIRDYMTRIIVP